MNRKVLTFLASTLLSAGLAKGQTFSEYSVRVTDTARLDAISRDFEIVGRDGDTYRVYVPVEKAANFQRLVPESELLAKDADASWRQDWNRRDSFAAGYHNWQSVQDYMTQAVQNYPQLVSQTSYGESKQGYKLSYLKITAPGSTNRAAKPKLFLDAATHGDELISTEVLLNLVDEILKGYGSDDRLTAMLDNTELYVSFVVNPDGYTKQNRYDNGVDPNRSYPWPGDPNHKPTASIQALMDLFEQQKFTGSMTLHAYGQLLMYPWGYTSTPISSKTDLDNFATLTDQLAAENNYTHGPIATTIYIAKGSSADYYYWKYNTQALAVELTTNKVPPSSKIPAVTDEAREMVFGFIEHFYKTAPANSVAPN